MASPVALTQSEDTNKTKATNVLSDLFTGDSEGSIVESPATTPGAEGEIPKWGSDVIPEEHLARTLILCFDGTGDQFDADVRIVSCNGENVQGLTMHRIPMWCSSYRC